MNKILLTPLAALCLYWSGAASSADFVAVRIEAENFTSKSDRWVLTTPDTMPSGLEDPDPPHNDTASGSANLELLPDTRVTHLDDVANGGMDGNFWGGPGGGPRIDYNIDMPEPGRYFVYVKTYSTGTEDNGIHVGMNNTLPQSGQRIQICSKHGWFWTSGQRTNDNHCGVTKTIWLDVPVAGTNTFTFFAREDGFEIDQIILLKETHDGSLDCFVSFADKIRCRDVETGATISDTEIPFSQTVGGNILTSNPTPQNVNIDLDIDINTDNTTNFVGDTIEYRVKVANQSSLYGANNTVATINLPEELQYNGSSVCSENNNIVSCDFGYLAANSNDTLSFSAQAIDEGDHRVDAQVSSDEDDSISSNNTDSLSVTSAFNILDYDLSLAVQQNSNVNSIGGSTMYSVTVSNIGLLEISNATLQITFDDGLALDQTRGCNSNCAIPTLATGGAVEIEFYTLASASGTQNVNALLVSADDQNTENNAVSLTETVIEKIIATDNNGKIVIEAESFSSLSPAATVNAPNWFLINPAFSALDTTLDPDFASPVGVSGSAYMELLPDTRIDANGGRFDGITNFDDGGMGATISYDVFFAEAGTYNIMARIRPNNTEDATLHFGLNNVWPGTSSSVSVCNPDGAWKWTNNLKTETGCSTSTVATITIEKPGLHELMVSQDTDGLELDKIILSKSPISNVTGNGPAPMIIDTYANADLSITTELSAQRVSPNEETQLVVSLTNESAIDAIGITINIEGLTQQSTPNDFDTCVNSASGTICSLAKLEANSQVSETFTLTESEPTSIAFQTSVASALADDNSLNNSDESTLTVSKSGGGAVSVWFLLVVLLAAFGIKVTAIPQRRLQPHNSNTHR